MLRQSSSRESESRWEEGFAKTDSGVFSWERLSTLVATSMRDYESSSPPVAPLSLDLTPTPLKVLPLWALEESFHERKLRTALLIGLNQLNRVVPSPGSVPWSRAWQKALPLLLVACCLWLVPATAAAQYNSAMRGVVSDSSGAVIPGASVIVKANATGIVTQMTTSESSVSHPAITRSRWRLLASSDT